MSTNSTKDFRGYISLLLRFFSLLFIVFSFHAAANNSIYYIDQSAGSNANNGLSSGTAWADFTHINAMTFQPGDQILLKCGSVWNSELHLSGSDTSGSFIIVDSYGSGNKPKIQHTFF